ncbi:MAG TPA: CehA/McbA family metallohydrolase [Solirubrobacterales bacterium]|nr:CehA/McbA family metallohydrolase [Solirubrobacterales bacterium]
MKAQTMRLGCGALAAVAAALATPAAATATDCPLPGSPGNAMDNVALSVKGDIDSARTGGYLQIPFDVPAGTTGIQVRYSYDQPGGGCGGGPNTLDMGVYEPKANPSSPAFEQSDRRGWSGSAVKNLAIAQNGFSDETTYLADRRAFVNGRTTRAYEPGPIPAGTWAVELGIAYVDPADADGIRYAIEVRTSTGAEWSDEPYDPSGPPDPKVNSTPGWYTGDFHVHGEQEPGNATMNQTFAAAFGPAGPGLDFITLVDHNNDVAHDDMQAQADAYPGNLVIPGVEVTTYRGHWNAQGSSSFADFRGGPIYTPGTLTSPIPDTALTNVRDATLPKDQFESIRMGGGWAQINHPTIFKDSPAACRGCFWNYTDADTDFSKVDAIEIQTGPAGIPHGSPAAMNPFTATAIEYYEHALDTGAHVAAVGSSDDHRAATATGPFDSSVGEGATVVHAKGLRRAAIVAAVKADHTYVKPFGPSGPDLTLEAANENGEGAIIGDSLTGRSLELTATVSGAAGTGRPGTWELTLLRDGVAEASVPVAGDSITQEWGVPQTGRYSIELTRTATSEFIEGYTSPIWLTVEPEPSNEFEIGEAKLNRKKGIAKLPVTIPGAGELSLRGESVKDVTAKRGKAKTVKLEVRPEGELERELREHGEATAVLTVTFEPRGGEPRSKDVTVELERRLKHR